MTPTFIKLELESFTTERLDRIKQQLTLIGIEDNLLVFRVDKKQTVISRNSEEIRYESSTKHV